MDDEKVRALSEARSRAVEAVADWAHTYGYENPVVTSWIVIAEVATPEYGRSVVWVAGDGGDPVGENRAGLDRWRIKGLMGEVDDQIRRNDVQGEG